MSRYLPLAAALLLVSLAAEEAAAEGSSAPAGVTLQLCGDVKAEDVKVEDVKVTAEQDSAYTLNTLIMFIAAVLVLLMQPGFAMLEVGLNAAKNTVNILVEY